MLKLCSHQNNYFPIQILKLPCWLSGNIIFNFVQNYKRMLEIFVPVKLIYIIDNIHFVKFSAEFVYIIPL